MEHFMRRPRILLADDHPAILKKVTGLLEPEFDVVGTVADGQALISAAAALQPDVVVVDISMPGINGIEAARQFKQAGSTAKIIFLTIHEDPDFLAEALSTSALGYVVKSRIATDLIPAIHEALANRSFVSPFQAMEGNG